MCETTSQPAISALDRLRGELDSELSALDAAALLRRLELPVAAVDFTSNDYLSLNRHGVVERLLRVELAALAGGERRVGSGGSRLLAGHAAAFVEAEERFAAWIAAVDRDGDAQISSTHFSPRRRALLFHSGYAANLGTMQALFSPRDTIYSDRLCHASLLDGVRLSGAKRIYFRHNDLNDLRRQIARHEGGGGVGRGRSWIVTESIFSMDGDRAPLSELAAIARESGALLYLDEAHAIGVFGPRGAGLAATLPVELRDSTLAVAVYPSGKALSLMGAFVVTPPELYDYLINRARSLLFSTAQPPLLARLLSGIIDYLQSDAAESDRMALHTKGEKLRSELVERGWSCGDSVSPIVPLLVGDEAEALALAERLRAAGVEVRAVRWPTVARGASRLRLILQAAHTEAEIAQLLEIIGTHSQGSGSAKGV